MLIGCWELTDDILEYFVLNFPKLKVSNSINLILFVYQKASILALNNIFLLLINLCEFSTHNYKIKRLFCSQKTSIEPFMITMVILEKNYKEFLLRYVRYFNKIFNFIIIFKLLLLCETGLSTTNRNILILFNN